MGAKSAKTRNHFIFPNASANHNNSRTNVPARLSVTARSAGTPFSSKLFCTVGTGKMAEEGTAFTRKKIVCNCVSTFMPPKLPADTVAKPIGFLNHSSYSKSIAFFRLAGML